MSPITVAVGVIQNPQQEIFLAQRAFSAHQGGKWEFPGGKVDPNEIPRQALTRELYEELGIQVERAIPLIRIHHDYSDKQVILDVWRITSYKGIPHGKEGQAVSWVPISELKNYEFPKANLPIITAITLPPYYVITSARTSKELMQQLTNADKKNYSLIRFRRQGWEKAEYEQALLAAITFCNENSMQLIIDGTPELCEHYPAAGLHLTSAQLFHYQERPISKQFYLSASCHNQAELQQAQKIQVDFAVLSPVLPTSSHPDAQLLGWPLCAQLIDIVNFPVYALGGMNLKAPAIWYGAQGSAGISAFLS